MKKGVYKHDSRTNFEHPSALFCNSIRVAKKTHWEPHGKTCKGMFATPKLGSTKAQKSMGARSPPHRAGTTRVHALSPQKRPPIWSHLGQPFGKHETQAASKNPPSSQAPASHQKMHDNCNTVKQENSSHAKIQIHAIKTTTKTQQHEMN